MSSTIKNNNLINNIYDVSQIFQQRVSFAVWDSNFQGQNTCLIVTDPIFCYHRFLYAAIDCQAANKFQ